MHVDNIKKVMEALSVGSLSLGTGKLGFCMTYDFAKLSEVPNEYFQHIDPDCTHVGCLMSFTILTCGDDKLISMLVNDYENLPFIPDHDAAALLDLDEETANDLFNGTLSSRITHHDARIVLHNLMVTGAVDWNRVEIKHPTTKFAV